MFNDDDFFDDDDDLSGKSFEDLLHEYEQVKKGATSIYLDDMDFEFIINYFFNSNREIDAIEACDIALKFHPFDPSFLITKAEILYQGQKYGQALKTLDTLEEIEKNNLEASILRAEIFMSQFKPEQAIALLEDKIQYFNDADKIEILHELADIYDEYEDFEAVFTTLKRILMINLRDEEALMKISYWADFASMNEESKKLHEYITEEDPFNAAAWFNLGATCQTLKQYDEAIDAYEYCIAIDEKYESAYRNMADVYMRQRRYNKAIESLQKNLELGKPEDVIFEALGNCFEKQKDFDRARHYYHQAIQLNPVDDAIFFRIGETYTRQKQWDKAIKAYTSAFNIDKSNANYCIAIGNCLLELEAYEEALVCFLNAIQLKPYIKASWVALAKGLYHNGLYDDIIDQMSMAHVCCGDKIEFDYYQVLALFALGKSKEAMLDLETLFESAPPRMKIISDLNPEIMQRKTVIDLLARYKKKKK